MSRSDVRELLTEDIEHKKQFIAKWAFTCKGNCLGQIEEGDEFFYFGTKKVCRACYDRVLEIVEEI